MEAGILDEGEELPTAEEDRDSFGLAGRQIRPGSEEFFNELVNVGQMHLAKSLDYGTAEDALANVRYGAELTAIEPWRACVVRIADKMQRIATYCRTGQLAHEGVVDSLLDMASYAILAVVFKREQQQASGLLPRR